MVQINPVIYFVGSSVHYMPNNLFLSVILGVLFYIFLVGFNDTCIEVPYPA
ncbi:MAG: hypothetical protein KIPDCIKN_02325 [Haliscomenobacter sp.]|nr:hypothetical protein [Haliscomenobacter sp.]